MDMALVAAGFFVGTIVGLTGMGGGALMTPILVLFFNVPALAAVSSDLVASFFMKPIGGIVHLRRGTVNLDLVKWLVVGSVPAAFLGVVLLKLLRVYGDEAQVQEVVRTSLGIALLVAAASMIVKSYLVMSRRARRRASGLPAEATQTGAPQVTIKKWPTIGVGVLGGIVVGMTSVGSGSLIIICLLALYPALSAGQLVGTDLVQAVPLVGAAALAHVFLGDFHMDLTLALLLGAIPGVWIGARMSSQAPGGVIRRALSVVLIASGLKLLGVSNTGLLIVLAVALVVGPVAWGLARGRNGLPRFVSIPQVLGAGRRPSADGAGRRPSADSAGKRTVAEEATQDSPASQSPSSVDAGQHR